MASRTISKVTTTVFISRCLKNARSGSLLRKAFECAWGVLAACLLALAAPALAQPPATEINQLRLERTEEGVLLSANITFELPTVIDDALDKGIPMFFVAEAVLFRDRWYWYDKQVAAAQHISHWKIAEASEVDPDARYNVDFRFHLDVSQLPRPFQIGAFGHSDWNIAALRNQRLAI